MEQALYRKYRPEKFSDVLGQDTIVQALKGALAQERIAHAYLFAGSRGTGKTSIARIVAREIGTSDNDLHEIDAASNRGIDDIRELREAVNTLPFESKFKVYIIDEVHMLTKEAFNALLKTLEEPPRHVVFILATTELHKLPETIVSRCQVHTFKKPSSEVLKELVLKIAKKEGIVLERSSGDLIATLADGSFRDAQGILQKVLSASSDKKISREEVEAITGAPSSTLVNQFLQALDEKDASGGLEALHAAVKQHIDMKIFLTLVLRKLRAVLLLRFAKDLEKDLAEEFSKEDMSFLQERADNKDTAITSATLRELLDAHTHIGFAQFPQLPIELAVIKLVKEV